jgi:hypothetical protein
VTEVILVGLVLSALGYALYLGRTLAKTKEELKHVRLMGLAQDRVIAALKEVHKNDTHLSKVLSDVGNATTTDELNQLYKNILGS